MILICLIFISMNWLPYVLEVDMLYYVLNALFQLVCMVVIFRTSKKSVLNLFLISSIMVGAAYDFIDYSLRALGVRTADYFNSFLYISVILLIYIVIFHRRYEWKKLNSDDYDPEKVQAIYSKPKSFMTLLGAAISHSPKCSVRYTYGGETIRFKKGSDTPIKQKTVILDTDIIIDTSLDPEYFGKRWAAIKNKRYNLLFFNCKGLLY